MSLLRWFSLLPILLIGFGSAAAVAQESACPEPALSRLVRHTIAPGETLDSIATQYNLIPATLMGMNPALRSGRLPVGTEIVVPPYNGIRVEVPAGTTWQEVAIAYNVRADVLFEVNGCQTEPRTVFIPGVNWSPNLATPRYGEPPQASRHNLRGYPLPNPAPVVLGYGWQPDPNESDITFSSGVGLATTSGTSAVAVGDGIVAFAGAQSGAGNVVVVNHPQGLQTRYAQLDRLEVSVGQQVRQGQRLGVVRAASDGNAYLYFEIRSNSSLGWVAEDPQRYIPSLGVK